jgi:hypothetical protein
MDEQLCVMFEPLEAEGARFAGLQPSSGVPFHLNARPDRRRHDVRKRLVGRIRAEYQEMPGLHLTVRQAARLFGLDGTCCRRVLDECVRDGWLCNLADDVYALKRQDG